MTAQSAMNCMVNGTTISDWGNNYGISTKDCVSYDVSSKINSLEDTVEAITKKPEVRADQRSSLKITQRVVAKFYENGFLPIARILFPLSNQLKYLTRIRLR